jgi:hypothetical protein
VSYQIVLRRHDVIDNNKYEYDYVKWATGQIFWARAVAPPQKRGQPEAYKGPSNRTKKQRAARHAAK